jgi:hypothetical protein
MIQGETSERLPLKIDIGIYKRLIASANDPYHPQALKALYLLLTGIETDEVNYMLDNGYLHIVPVSGQGCEEDCRIMRALLQQ